MRLANPPAQGWRAVIEQQHFALGSVLLAQLGRAPEKGWTLKTADESGVLPPTDDGLIRIEMLFSLLWVQGGMPKIVMGHKLAAVLMASEADGDVLRGRAEAPFDAYYIELPDNLMHSDTGEIAGIGVLRYGHIVDGVDLGWAWCAMDRGGALIGGWGLSLVGMQSYDTLIRTEHERLAHKKFQLTTEATLSPRELRIWGVIGRLIVGTNIYINSGSAERREQKTTFHVPGTGHQRPPMRPVYKITRDVQIDLRGDVQRYIDGETKDIEAGETPGRTIGVRFRVRGHYKMQPHGPRSSLRKLIHREPYWIGKDTDPVAVRSHDLGDG